MNRITHLFLIVCAAALAGCASPQSQFYTLSSTATGNGPTNATYGIAVGPVTIPASVDRPQFVLQNGPNRIELNEFNRWAAPLSGSIARVVAGDLAALLGAQVAATSLVNFDSAYRVSIEVQRFESTPGKSAVIEAVWVLRKSGADRTRSGRTVASETVQGEGFEALAAAHSQALAKLSGDIAAAIRAEAAGAKQP